MGQHFVPAALIQCQCGRTTANLKGVCAACLAERAEMVQDLDRAELRRLTRHLGVRRLRTGDKLRSGLHHHAPSLS